MNKKLIRTSITNIEAGPCSPGPMLNDAQRRVIRNLGLALGSEKIHLASQDKHSKLFENGGQACSVDILAAF